MRRLLCLVGWHRPVIRVAGTCVQLTCVRCHKPLDVPMCWTGRGWKVDGERH